jgi:hypothetical protein
MKGMNPTLPPASTPQKPAGRTWELKLLAASFLVVSVFGWLRMQQVLATWDWLQQVLTMPSPAYLVFSGALWGLAGAACALALWLRMQIAPLLARTAACALAAWYWIERILLTRSPQGWVNWPFSLAFTVVSLAFVFSVLAHPRQKRFFERQ